VAAAEVDEPPAGPDEQLAGDAPQLGAGDEAARVQLLGILLAVDLALDPPADRTVDLGGVYRAP